MKYSSQEIDTQSMVNEPALAYYRRQDKPINISILRSINASSGVVTTALGITEKTYKVYFDKGKELSPLQSEWVLGYKELHEFGSRLFGNFYRFENWLSKFSERLNAIPNEIITTVSGIQQIKRELAKIAEGYPA